MSRSYATTLSVIALCAALLWRSAVCCARSVVGDSTARERLRVGLVLGGGGAKGAAEVGVLKVIEEVGLPIDYIAGTSIGAINGGLYAIGYDASQLETLYLDQDWIDMFVSGATLDELKRLTNGYDVVSFDSLPIPYRCVAVDIEAMQEVVIDSGCLAEAMRASMAIPGVFKPVTVDGRTLVDGGVLNNLPVDVVRAMGADVVIAVDLTQNKRKTRNIELTSSGLIGKAIGWVVSRPDIKKYNDNVADADVYINPALDGYTAAHFTVKKIAEMITVGYKAGSDSRRKLKSLKKRVMQGR